MHSMFLPSQPLPNLDDVQNGALYHVVLREQTTARDVQLVWTQSRAPSDEPVYRSSKVFRWDAADHAAERDLRSGVSARKVSQCSKTQGGADSCAMIKSIVETAKRHHQPPLDVLVGLQARAAPH